MEEYIEDEKVQDFEQIEKNFQNLEQNPDENIKNIIFKEIDKKHITEALINKTLEIYNRFKLIEKNNGVDILKLIFFEVLKFSKFNFSSRVVDFFDYILSIAGLKYEFIEQALKIKNKDLPKDNNKDIIFFWKQKIAEFQLKEEKIPIASGQMKDSLELLLKHNFNINEIMYIFLLFRKVIIDDRSTQIDILNCMISILILYPKFLNEKDEFKRQEKEEELKNFINNYIIIDERNKNKNDVRYVFDEKKNVALDFYLKISGDKSYNESSELSIPEIFQHLKINNPDISEEKINKIELQLKEINTEIDKMKKTKKTYSIIDFQNWTNKLLPKLKGGNADIYVSKILAMISFAIKTKRGYFLRNTQLVAILLFINKERKKGLIEEISTGEGKSCIISSLSIYYALMGHKVDIISSSYTLAQRDSDEFKELYSCFNLTTGFPFDSNPEPYKTHILYGTFLEFEGDYLREITSDRNIRNKRPFDVIIIDEVDNLFIDNILGSTRLTNSSRGFKFLIPFYLTIYLSYELFDYFFFLFFKVSLNSIENNEKRKKFENLIKDPKKRKKEMINLMQSNLEDIFGFNNPNKKDSIISNMQNEVNNKKKMSEEQVQKFENAIDDHLEFISNLTKILEFPEFLSQFVEVESQYWLDSAYNAKNLMEIDRDYVEIVNDLGNREIAPVDWTNTGEIELSTFYGEGLHQMLEIKHRLRVKDETLVHTFLSHITYFQKYKKQDEFLFFGLTGTIGDKETQKIYGNKYFDSNLLFIPQYKKKRFIELPPLLVNIKDHLYYICKDIVINFYKSRKVLVICNSIREAKIIEKELKNRIQPQKFGIDNNLIAKEDFRDSIILYTRSDTEKDNIKQRKKRIILSTNLGGRGTDIRTSEEEEDAGGLHVIITYMPNNYRVLKQAFGRTSREGKKGTGQIILKNTGYNSYKEVIEEMNENEKREMSRIVRKSRVLLFKDTLFKEYVEIIKSVDFNGYLIDDINERWANFLVINVTSKGDDLNKEETKKKFEEFKEQIRYILISEYPYKQFENPFYQMQEGLRLYNSYENEMINYYDFDSKINKFYFAQPYMKAIIKIVNTNNYNPPFFNEVISLFDETINRINLLLNENINPILTSFDQWENALNNLEAALKTSENVQMLANLNIENPFADKDYVESDLCKQYLNIKMIFSKILERIEENKRFMENFKKEHKEDKDSKIVVTEQDLEIGLALNEEEIKEIPFFVDATFKYVFKLSIRKKSKNLNSSFWFFLFLGVIVLLFLIGNPIISGLAAFAFFSYQAIQAAYVYKKGWEISTESLYGNIFLLILKTVKNRKGNNYRNRVSVIKHVPGDKELVKSNKALLFNKIMENIEIKFDNLKKSDDILKFLLFIDNYYSENIWAEKITKIFKDKFDQVYKPIFTENDFFKTSITNESLNEHLFQYNSLFDQYLSECKEEINNLGKPKKYNKADGLNCLEHLIIDLNSEKITEDIANQIVQKMLEYRLVFDNGEINKKLFIDYFKGEKGQNLEQKIKININNKIIQVNSIKKISNVNEFQITGFEIPLVNSSFIDLSNFYQIKNYNVQQHLEKDFSIYIINNFKKIIINILHMNPNILESFYKHSLILIKKMVKSLLEEKIFTKYNKNTFENAIEAELTDEERVEFSKMVKEATNQAANLFQN